MRVKKRAGINFRAMHTCLVPHLAFSVLLKHANTRADFDVSVGYVQYLRMLVMMVATPECEKFINTDDVFALSTIVEAMIDAMDILGGGPAVGTASGDYFSSSASSPLISLCLDRA
jgi:hypothetical protein